MWQWQNMAPFDSKDWKTLLERVAPFVNCRDGHQARIDTLDHCHPVCLRSLIQYRSYTTNKKQNYNPSFADFSEALVTKKIHQNLLTTCVYCRIDRVIKTGKKSWCVVIHP